jgi:hypothetical protein
MNVRDEDLRAMLSARSNRAGWIDADRLVAESVDRPLPRAARPAITALRDAGRSLGLIIVVVALIGVAVSAQGAAQARPVGIWQSRLAVGTGEVGSRTCVALNLSDDAYKTGQVSVWWWAPGQGDCRTSSSSPTQAVAQLTPVSLPASGSGALRSAYRVQLDLDLLGGGSERVEFVLDPLGQSAGAGRLAGSAGADLGGRPLDFTRVPGVDVAPPGGVPAPTPEATTNS